MIIEAGKFLSGMAFMNITFEQLTRLRDNLDGLGYSFGPRGLFGIGNEQEVFDSVAMGGGNITPNNSLRSLAVLDAYSRSAIYAFQRDQNIAATGNYGDDLRDRLELTVRTVQNNLKIILAKQDADLISGYYGLKTFQYMKDYQQSKGLPVTGLANTAVQRLLNEDARRLLGKPSKDASTDAQSQLNRIIELKALLDKNTISPSGFIEAIRGLLP
jgi:peptidoglycan hydrolase-like protein with peptidoglycan-binding domain